MRLILAPSNLGLRPLRPGHVPGTWAAPEALLRAGLRAAVGVEEHEWLRPLPWSAETQPGTRLGNGPAMRSFNLALADTVAASVRANAFALVIGGDCSILLGALAGARRSGALFLIHLDGHSDFRHSGNYDPLSRLSGVAGMDLALATGRGEPLGTDWPDVTAPLVQDAHVIQVGERENLDENYEFADIADTAITRIDIVEMKAIGAVAVERRITAKLEKAALRFWVHLDLDILDESVMPAVDCPGAPGLLPDELATILRPLVADADCLGMTVTSFDPERDPDGRHAALVTKLLGELEFRADLR